MQVIPVRVKLTGGERAILGRIERKMGYVSSLYQAESEEGRALAGAREPRFPEAQSTFGAREQGAESG